MQKQNVVYQPIYQKVEDVETGTVNTFKVLDSSPAEISESDGGVTVTFILESGEELKGKSEYTGRIGLKIAYAKAVRKVLKEKIDEMEREAVCVKISSIHLVAPSCRYGT